MESLNENTISATHFGVKIIKDWCLTNTERIDFEDIPTRDLDRLLAKFYAGVRTKQGLYYSDNTLNILRYSLNRYLNSPPFFRKLDVTSSIDFPQANCMFNQMIMEIKRTKAIAKQERMSIMDVYYLYNSGVFNPNHPKTLLYKVWFEFIVHFCKRGRDFQREISKKVFLFDRDVNGRRFVKTLINMNGRGPSSASLDNTPVNAASDGNYCCMKEHIGDPLCPVSSLEKYIAKLNPDCSYLFQVPRIDWSPDDEEWYDPTPVSKKTLGQLFMLICRDSNLNRTYSNGVLKFLTPTFLQKYVFHPRALKRMQPVSTNIKEEFPPATNLGQQQHDSVAMVSPMLKTDRQEKDMPQQTYDEANPTMADEYKGVISLQEAKQEVVNILERLQFEQLTDIVQWMKRVEVLKDVTGRVICRDSITYTETGEKSKNECSPSSSNVPASTRQRVDDIENKVSSSPNDEMKLVLKNVFSLAPGFKNSYVPTENGSQMKVPTFTATKEIMPTPSSESVAPVQKKIKPIKNHLNQMDTIMKKLRNHLGRAEVGKSKTTEKPLIERNEPPTTPYNVFPHYDPGQISTDRRVMGNYIGPISKESSVPVYSSVHIASPKKMASVSTKIVTNQHGQRLMVFHKNEKQFASSRSLLRPQMPILQQNKAIRPKLSEIIPRLIESSLNQPPLKKAKLSANIRDEEKVKSYVQPWSSDAVQPYRHIEPLPHPLPQ